MKNALIVYESMFGGTRRVAEAIADGLSPSTRCTVTEVGDAPTVVGPDVDLLVIGAPTHAFGMSTPDTRHEAQHETSQPVISRELGVREWLAALVVLAPHTRTAAFDTRVKQRWVPGSAAHKIARVLTHKGLSQVQEPISFRVEGKTGPLLDGELARARHWATCSAIDSATPPPSPSADPTLTAAPARSAAQDGGPADPARRGLTRRWLASDLGYAEVSAFTW